MRDRWYSDNRDLVKWGTLVHLAQTNKITTIFQVAFYRADSSEIILQTSKGPVPFPSVVLDHFRKIEQIAGLQKLCGIDIRVVTTSFGRNGSMPSGIASRKNYVEKAILELQNHRDRLIALLDPDTGIAPKNSDFRHVLPLEIRQIYTALSVGCVLVLYQHARRERDWVALTRSQFADAVGILPSQVQTYQSDLATDVALFAAKKD